MDDTSPSLGPFPISLHPVTSAYINQSIHHERHALLTMRSLNVAYVSPLLEIVKSQGGVNRACYRHCIHMQLHEASEEIRM